MTSNMTRNDEKVYSKSNMDVKFPKLVDKQDDQRSLDESRMKKIVLPKLWWNKSNSTLKIPLFHASFKNAKPKVGSLDKVGHKPGGGSINVMSEKLQWRKIARTETHAKDYVPNAGSPRKIFSEKLGKWEAVPRVGSLSGGNIQIIHLPFDKKKFAKPRVDCGFVYEEVVVPEDYEVTPRIKSFMQLEPIKNKNGGSVGTGQSQGTTKTPTTTTTTPNSRK